MTQCTCTCGHTGGAYQRPCSEPGGCGSIGCDGHGNIGRRQSPGPSMARIAASGQTAKPAAATAPPPAETPAEGYCRSGQWCANRDARGNPAPADARSFCMADEQHGRFAISQLPADYHALAEILGKDISPSGGGSSSGAPGPRLPLRENVDSLMRQIRWSLETWEVNVRERARLSDVPEHGVRAEIVVDRAATILVDHYSVLLAYGATDILDYETAVAVDADGPGAVVELTQLHHRARSMLGLTKRREARALPCPDCGLTELGQDIGTNAVDCTRCGWNCTLDDYATYATTFQAPRRAA